MGIAGPSTPPAKKKKRRRKSKSLSQDNQRAHDHPRLSKKKMPKSSLSKPLSPWLPGAYKQSPITIESDDEDQVTSLETCATAIARSHSLPDARSFDARVYDERLISLEPSTPKTRNFPAAQRNRRAQISSSNSRRSQARMPRETSSSITSFPDDGIELTLVDIQDFTLRQKTAQLMAVAPGLPVADLYHLLMDKKGHFEAAKQDVIRQSQKPQALPLPLRAATAPSTSPTHPQIKDEAYIKIDFDDPDFMFDSDAPPPEPHRQTGPKKPSKKSAAKKSTLEATRHSTPTFTSKIDVNRGMRATSYDREFIVPDDEVLDDTDETYSDRDDSDLGDFNITEDDTDLSIDMTPEYSYNSAVLAGLSAG